MTWGHAAPAENLAASASESPDRSLSNPSADMYGTALITEPMGRPFTARQPRCLILSNPILDTATARHFALRRSLIVGNLQARREALIRTIAHLKRQHKATALAQADLQDVTARLLQWGA